MKKIVFVLLMVLVCSNISSAQEITIASISEAKTNARWLKSTVQVEDTLIVLNATDKSEIGTITKLLATGRDFSKAGIFFSPTFVIAGVINTTQGAFTRMPAHFRLNRLIQYKYYEVQKGGYKYSDANLNVLLEAKRNLDIAQRNSNLAIVLTVIQGAYAMYLYNTSEGLLSDLFPNFIVYISIPITNTIFTGINLGRLNKAIRALNQL